ncbi:activator-dependent family glycosyltransferase [Natronosporangium hydrolyticum]|uniref:Activator-dependent family glycosyltransferase n=1 Tax=Natronosporangium hydrolyticum TaxID=2811111 RepID=A0A895YPI4_9ACTN|nr:activator-dependent family glycosyltransferase [Natronosporangium hydrolyticum]QSB16020.1 activator-dependent family glycosyltransferase [Natronosporangium hydrolyticum]
MRILATVFATKPHLYNLVPLAWALQAAGHEVRVASHPDLTEAITRTGLTAVPVGNELNMMSSLQEQAVDPANASAAWEDLTSGMLETRPERLTWPYLLGSFTMACSTDYEYLTDQVMLEELVEFAQWWQPELVIWDALTFAGAIAARACGAAHARMLFGLDHISRMYYLYRRHLSEQPPELRDDPVNDWLQGRLDLAGEPFHPDDADELMTGQWTIDPTPEWMQLPLEVPCLRVRYVPFNGPGSPPAWVYEPPRRPRVCLSLGMSGRDLLGGDLISADDLLAALGELDIELIATLNADQLTTTDNLPPNIRIVDFIPLNELAPTCAAVIHHGGFGTLGNVLVHGIPSLTIPAPWWDEADLGQHLHHRKAGQYLHPTQLTTETLTTALNHLLHDPSYRHNAQTIQTEIRHTPSPNDLTTTLEKLTHQHRRRRPSG